MLVPHLFFLIIQAKSIYESGPTAALFSQAFGFSSTFNPICRKKSYIRLLQMTAKMEIAAFKGLCLMRQLHLSLALIPLTFENIRLDL